MLGVFAMSRGGLRSVHMGPMTPNARPGSVSLTFRQWLFVRHSFLLVPLTFLGLGLLVSCGLPALAAIDNVTLPWVSYVPAVLYPPAILVCAVLLRRAYKEDAARNPRKQ